MHDAEVVIAALHRDWREAQGNYDEFRFFTGLRPSEQIALVMTDVDVENGIVSINKARVAGVDRCKTKTGDDRRLQLCPRALLVLKRQLALRERLVAAGLIHHEHVFVYATGEPMRDSQVATTRWRKTLLSLKVRYRRPYTARHSSVSWNLMLGKNVLWVAKQHGHNIITMLRIYAAWTEGAVEADVTAIERSMMLTRTPPRDRPRKPPRSGGRLANPETAAPPPNDLAVVQSVPKTITEVFAACESRIRRLTACTE
jgi:integrase